jgi:hypothetical protein
MSCIQAAELRPVVNHHRERSFAATVNDRQAIEINNTVAGCLANLGHKPIGEHLGDRVVGQWSGENPSLFGGTLLNGNRQHALIASNLRADRLLVVFHGTATRSPGHRREHDDLVPIHWRAVSRLAEDCVLLSYSSGQAFQAS